MPVLNEAAKAALSAGHLAHLVTLNPDGGPQITVVWVGVDDDDIVLAHLGSGQKIRNLRSDPRVSLSMETGGHNEVGLAQYLIVHGRAALSDGGGPELLQQLAHVYLGPDVKFPPWDDPPPGVVVHITPERAAGVGPWSD
ncbi:MAG TPA: TIGR03618 family F420-dependent PPOX class oxidoreductase [Acidimicrobiia bacterium]|nr:TIGR03618 family F420-dependent PPOX class oxidoreductase [Acidimicrobiia bacterium]